MLQNKWRHGPTRFEIPDFGPVLDQFDGLMPFYVVLDPDIGQEVVLILRDRTDFINTLKATKPFRLFVKTGLARNQYGPLGFPAFLDSGPEKSKRLRGRLRYVHKSDGRSPDTALRGSRFADSLAFDSCRSKRRARGLFEFENCYGLNGFVSSVRHGCKGILMMDFYRAREQFGRENSLREIFEM